MSLFLSVSLRLDGRGVSFQTYGSVVTLVLNANPASWGWDAQEVCTPLGTLMRNNLTALEALNHSSFAKRSDRDSTQLAARSFLGLSTKYKKAHAKHWTEMEAEGDPAFGVNPQVRALLPKLTVALPHPCASVLTACRTARLECAAGRADSEPRERGGRRCRGGRGLV